jgi:hypothetical protein
VSFSYPKGWAVVPEQSKIVVSSSADAAEKFFDRDPRKPDGVQITVMSEKSDSMQSFVKYIEELKSSKSAEGYKVKEIEDAKIEGLPAKKVEFSGAFDERTKIKVICVATLKDSTIYSVQFAGFNEMFEPYRSVLDTVLSTLTLPVKIVVQKGVDPAIPLASVSKYQDNNLQLEYPANFGVSEMPKKGDMVAGLKVTGAGQGMRNDCDINIDIRPSKKLTVEKVVDQNAKFFKSTSRGEIKISGEKSIFLNYSPVRNIDSRVYFVVKNEKIYRIILNYFTPMKKEFLPAFEKVVASIRIK